MGKTTTTINLAASLAALSARVLVIDLDPQGNASTGLGVPRAEREITSYDLLIGDATVAEATVSTQTRNVDLIAATPDLSSIEMELGQQKDRLNRLRAVLRTADQGAYDYTLLDCPPSLNLLTLNGLIAANGVLIPLQCEFFALEGISQLLHTIGEVRQTLNPGLITQGIVLTMYDQRNRLTSDVEDDVRQTLGPLVLKTVIPRNVRLSEAPSHGLPVRLYDPRSSGAIAYMILAREVMRRVADAQKTEAKDGTKD